MKRQKKPNKYTQADRYYNFKPTKVNPKVARIIQAAAATSMMAAAATGETPYMNVDPDSDLGKAIEDIDSSNGDDT